VRYRAQARGVEKPAEAIARRRDRASKGLVWRIHALSDRDGWAEAQKFYDEALAGVRAHGLDAAMVLPPAAPKPEKVGKLRGATDTGPAPISNNDRMQVAAGVAAGTMRAEHLVDRGQPRRPTAASSTAAPRQKDLGTPGGARATG